MYCHFLKVNAVLSFSDEKLFFVPNRLCIWNRPKREHLYELLGTVHPRSVPLGLICFWYFLVDGLSEGFVNFFDACRMKTSLSKLVILCVIDLFIGYFVYYLCTI